ncbi:MAG: tetratricopeptide repeat protein [bacterium]
MKRRIVFLSSVVLFPLVVLAGMELTSARVYRKQGEFQKALEWYDKAVASDPRSVVAHFERGDLLGQMADEQKKPELFLEMRKSFDAVLNLAEDEPKQVKKYRPKITELVEKYWIFQYNEAVERFRLADKDSALDAAAGQLAGETWATLEAAQRDSLRKVAKRDYWKQSQDILVIALAILPDRWENFALLQNIQSQMGDWTAAEISLRQAIEKHARPKEAAEKKSAIGQTESEWRRAHLEMLGNLAQISYELKKHQQVVEVCNQILAMDPQNLLAIKLIAFSYNLLGNREKAVADSLKAMAAQPDTTDLLYNAARLYFQKAIDVYQKAMAAQPDNTDLLYNAARLYLQMEDTAKAVKCLTDFLAIDPTDFEVVFQLGVIYLEGGSFADNNKAKELFGNATKHFPNNPVIWTNYGVALIRTGETEEGRKAIEKAKALKGE